MKKHLYLLIIIPFGMVFLTASYALEKQVEEWLYDLTEKSLSRELDNISTMIELSFPNNDYSDLNQFVKKLDNDSSYRITILNNAGDVIADSWLSYDEILQLENHANRSEITSTSALRNGVSVRHSDTINEELMYVSRLYENGAFNGYIRLALPLEIVNADLALLHNELLKINAIEILILLFVIFIIGKYINNVQTLTNEKMALQKGINERIRDRDLLQNFQQMLISCSSLEELSEVIDASAERLFEGTSGALALNYNSMNYVEIISSWGTPTEETPAYTPEDCWAFRRGTTHFWEEDSITMKCKHFTGNESSLCVPLQSQGSTLGSLHLYASNKKFDQHFKELMYIIAEQISLAISNINLRRKLEQQALRDPLTNLYNRRHLNESLEREISRAKRRNTSLGIMMIDIDYFKKFNDTFGHDAGDFVLKKIASLFSHAIRGEDFACRYGGEEFVIVMTDAKLQIVQKRAEEILVQASEMNLEYQNKPLGSINLSIGISIYPEHGETQDQLLTNADSALYCAKKGGRNQLQIALTLNSDNLEEQEMAKSPLLPLVNIGPTSVTPER